MHYIKLVIVTIFMSVVNCVTYIHTVLQQLTPSISKLILYLLNSNFPFLPPLRP